MRCKCCNSDENVKRYFKDKEYYCQWCIRVIRRTIMEDKDGEWND